MRRLVESIRGDAEMLGVELGRGGKNLDLLLRKAKETLQALNVELTEEADAMSEPVMLPPASLAQARAALGTGEVEQAPAAAESA